MNILIISAGEPKQLISIITGLHVFTPYHRWHRDHQIHHRTVGNLEKRGTGDVMTLTVEEYNKMSRWKRFVYRLYRHPVFLIGIAPMLLFVVLHRLPKKQMSANGWLSNSGYLIIK